MSMTERSTLSDLLAVEYPFNVIADPDGGYVIRFPDLPGCLTQVESIDEVGQAASEIKALWIETEYEHGAEIPMPSFPEAFSGKFNLRLPKSLHCRLVEQAVADSVSLNQLIVSMLSGASATKEALAVVHELAVVQREIRRDLAVMTSHTEEIRPQATTYEVQENVEPRAATATSRAGNRLKLVAVAA